MKTYTVTRSFISPGVHHVRARSVIGGVASGHWPNNIKVEFIPPDFWLHSLYWSANIRVGSTNGYGYKARLLLNGLPITTLYFSDASTSGPAVPDGTSFSFGSFGSSANGLELLKSSNDFTNFEWKQPFTFACSLDAIDLTLDYQFGPDSSQRPSWILDVISTKPDRSRSLPGLVQKV